MPRKKLNNYWDEQVMSAHINHYNTLTDQTEMSDYFLQYIYPSLNKLSECIVRRWKWEYVDLSIENLQDDLLTFLSTKLNTFKEKSGRSFSYLTVIGKRHLIQMNDYSYKKSLINISLNVEDEDGVPMTGRIEREMADKQTGSLPPFCDVEFLDQLSKYFTREQIDGGVFFNKNYNPVLEEILSIIDDRKQHDIDGHAKAFNRLVRENQSVVDIDMKGYRSVKTNSRTSVVISKIKKISRSAYRYYLNNGNLDNFVCHKPFVLNLFTRARQNSISKAKLKAQRGH